MPPVLLVAAGFSDPAWFEAGWGKLLTSPLGGGLAVLLAALLAFFGTVLNIRSGRKDTDKKLTAARVELDEKLRADREDSDRKLNATRAEAIAARTQARRADAYVSLTEVSERVGLWVQQVQRAIDRPVELPDEAMQHKATAQLLAFGSSAVKAAWESWQQQVEAALTSDHQMRLSLDTVANHSHDGDLVRRSHARQQEFQEQLELVRPLEVKRRRALQSQMNEELAEEAAR